MVSMNMEARAVHRALCQRAQAAAKGTTSGSSQEQIAQGPATTTPTASKPAHTTALHEFRKIYMAGNLDRELNWVSKDAWQEVRAAFDGLSAEEKAGYTSLAKSINAGNFARKRARLNDSSAAVPEQNRLELPQGSGSIESVQHAGFAAMDSTQLEKASQSVDDFFSHLRGRFRDSKSLDKSNWPLQESNVLQALLSLKTRKVTIKILVVLGLRASSTVYDYDYTTTTTTTTYYDYYYYYYDYYFLCSSCVMSDAALLRTAVATLHRLAETVAGPENDEDNIQDVFYDYPCPGMCLQRTGLRAKQLFLDLVKSLNAIAGKFQTPRDLVNADVLLCFFIKTEGICRERFALMASCAFQGGVQKPIQSYCLLQPLEQNQTAGNMRLVFAQEPHVAQSVPWPQPICRGVDLQCGCLQTRSTSQLAAEIVQPAGPDFIAGSAAVPDEVRIRKMLYRDVSRSVIEVTGADESWDAMTVPPATSKRKPASKAKPKAKPKPQMQASSASGQLDFLAMLSAGAEAGHPSQHQQPAPVDASAESAMEKHLHEEIMATVEMPPDPTASSLSTNTATDFLGILDDEEISLLQERRH